MARRAALPVAIFVFCALVYVLFLGKAPLSPSPNNHYVHLARSFLHGQLSVIGNKPPGNNDWALYNGTWYVTFPPVPAIVLMPVVAFLDLATPDRLIWALLAALSPALLFVLLERLAGRGESLRTRKENLVLTALFAFGTVFFYVSVQGSVWFSAHVVATALLLLYVLAALGAAHPVWAGICLGLSYGCRPTTFLAFIVFVVEAMRAHRRAAYEATELSGTAPGNRELPHPLVRAWAWVRATDFRAVLPTMTLFALPVALLLGLSFWFNLARFDDPLTYGHEFLQIRWQGRIERWGMFAYHYFSKNLAVFLASLPWITNKEPWVIISRHGLALWFTTPGLLWLLWPKRMDARMVGMYLSVILVGLWNLTYQNSGWVQFGYRFACDYMVFMLLLLALGARRFGPGFFACLVFAVVVNGFGAATFDRAHEYYDDDRTQNRVFQPD